MSSISPAPSPGPAVEPDPEELCERLIEETRRRTGYDPRPWQLQNAMDRIAGKDALILAATGSGKTLPSVMPAFVIEQSITWILAPLNVIEEQQVEVFNKWKVPAICINQRSKIQKVRKKILAGKYKVVISSPEAFLDTNKLRSIVTSDELRDYRHFVVVDEAHVIQTWAKDFREAYGRVGNLRAMLFDVPFSAVTATATEPIKAAIIAGLHLGANCPLVVTNLGNYRNNIEHSVFQMSGGMESYREITRFFPSADEIEPTLVFVDSVANAHKLADVLREHLKWTGDLAQRVRPYHSHRAQSGKDHCIRAFKTGECKIIIATEALTMGCDFDVRLMIQFGAPGSVTTYMQRAGRTGRKDGTRARAIMMITANQYQKALKLSSGKKDLQPDDIVDPKTEDGEVAAIGDALDELEVEDGVGDENRSETEHISSKQGKKPHHRSREMDINIARLVTTQTCRVKVLDAAFNNPPHDSCYDNKTCDLCVARRARDESTGQVDLHARQRDVKREEVEIIMETGWDNEDGEAKRKRPPGGTIRTGKEYERFKTHLRGWRGRTLRSEGKRRYCALEDIATDKVLDAIARSKDLVDVALLDNLKPLWSQRGRYGQEVVEVVLALTRELEEEKRQEEKRREEEKRRKEEAVDRARAEAMKAKEDELKRKKIEATAARQAEMEYERATQNTRQEVVREAQQRANEMAIRVAGQAAAVVQERAKLHAPGYRATPSDTRPFVQTPSGPAARHSSLVSVSQPPPSVSPSTRPPNQHPVGQAFSQSLSGALMHRGVATSAGWGGESGGSQVRVERSHEMNWRMDEASRHPSVKSARHNATEYSQGYTSAHLYPSQSPQTPTRPMPGPSTLAYAHSSMRIPPTVVYASGKA
ncbi:hypothetical protein FRC10_005424, partial [Ceratobasidium sp. 414]